MRHTARALIIQDKKLLLVSTKGKKVYWTPGGGIEKGETRIEALRRELREELSVEVESATSYISYTLKDFITGEDFKASYFLVTIDREPIPSGEITKFCWYSKENFVNTMPAVSPSVPDLIFPKLMEDKLI